MEEFEEFKESSPNTFGHGKPGEVSGSGLLQNDKGAKR